jgi:hypothetical protein
VRAIGHAQTEAQLILGQAEVARGAVEGLLLGLPDDRAAQSPGSGRPSVQEILDQGVREEGEAATAILRAVG